MTVVVKVEAEALLEAVAAVLEVAKPLLFFDNTLNLQSDGSDLKQTKATA